MTAAKLQDAAILGLKVLNVVANIASKFFPPISIVSSLIESVLDVVEKKKSFKELQEDFKFIHNRLDELSKQSHEMMENIIKETADQQFNEVRWKIKNQYKKYMELTEAPPEEIEKGSQKFVKGYQDGKGNQYLYTLYESVISVPKVFSKPILQVYKQHSGTNRETMVQLTQELFSLFSIGCITMMAHAVLIGDDVEGRREEWEEKMKRVTLEMEKALEDYKEDVTVC
uniref:Rapunzel n=1 Tax=Oryzias sinensis TaxID=183150 RepID=A0A8C7Y8J8_9TELE